MAADVPYIRYFAAHILQFMFYKELCLVSKQYDPNVVIGSGLSKNFGFPVFSSVLNVKLGGTTFDLSFFCR